MGGSATRGISWSSYDSTRGATPLGCYHNCFVIFPVSRSRPYINYYLLKYISCVNTAVFILEAINWRHWEDPPGPWCRYNCTRHHVLIHLLYAIFFFLTVAAAFRFNPFSWRYLTTSRLPFKAASFSDVWPSYEVEESLSIQSNSLN